MGGFHEATSYRLSQCLHLGAVLLDVHITLVVANPGYNRVFSGPAGHETIKAVVGGTGLNGEVPAIAAVEFVTKR
jgi:hypothetical protein